MLGSDLSIIRAVLRKAFYMDCQSTSRGPRDEVTIYFRSFDESFESLGIQSVIKSSTEFRNRLPRPRDLEEHVLNFRVQNLRIHNSSRLNRPPAAFYEEIILARGIELQSTKVNVTIICEAIHEQHPTIKYLILKFGARVQSQRKGFSNDFCSLMKSRSLIVSPSTFGWWAAFLSDFVSEVHFPVLPLATPMPWCDLVVDDTQWKYYNVERTLRRGPNPASPVKYDSPKSAQDACRNFENRAKHDEKWANDVVSLYRFPKS